MYPSLNVGSFSVMSLNAAVVNRIKHIHMHGYIGFISTAFLPEKKKSCTDLKVPFLVSACTRTSNYKTEDLSLLFYRSLLIPNRKVSRYISLQIIA